MPTYDYECKACGHAFEELQSFSEPALTRCPKCKKNKLERLFGGGGAIAFKGSGFYETDYRRAGDAKTNGDGKAETPAAETKSEAKPESASGTGGDSASTGGAAAAGKPADASKAKKAK